MDRREVSPSMFYAIVILHLAGGLEELLQSFQDSRVQYGFVGFQSEDGKLQKVLLIHWVIFKKK